MANFNNGKNIFVVVQCQKEKEVLARLNDKASSLFGRGRYAYILHDKDVLDNGEIKGKHIHILLCAETGKSSNSWIEHFAKGLGVDPTAISVQMQGSEKKCLRYLLHLDDGTKHQYDRSEVVTNMDDVCKKAWSATTGFVSNPSLDQLEKAYKEGPRALYNLVGMNAFNRARNVCETIIRADTQAQDLAEKCDYYEKVVYRLRNFLASYTANPQYLEKGYIPFREFEKTLYECDEALEAMTQYQRMIKKKTHD